MAHLTYVRAAGVWNVTTDLLSSEMAAFDAHQFKAINGDDGGTWAPAAQIIIAGAGFACAGPLDVSGTGTITSTINFNTGSILDIKAGATFETESGSTFNVKAGTVATVAAATTLSGNNTFSGTGAYTGTNTWSNTSTFNGALSATSTATLSGDTTVTGANLLKKRYRSIAVDTDVTLGTGLDSGSSDYYTLATALTSNRKWTLAIPTNSTPCTVRCMAENTSAFSGFLAGNTLTIANYNGVAAFVLLAAGWVDMYFDGSNWLPVASGGF